MIVDAELRDRVYQMFVLEVPRMLQSIETELVNFSCDRSESEVNNLLRAAHSIKGCAANLGLAKIQDLAHQMEDIFRVLNHPELPWTSQLEKLIFQLYDCLSRLVMSEIRGEVLSSEIEIFTEIVLANLDEEIGHFMIVGQQFSDVMMFGVDLTQSIFEVDVVQSLARLDRVFSDPASAWILAGEFRAQAEVFTGIAELVTLPGFGLIAHSTIAALDRQPHRTREICAFALADFSTALAAVLAGDRQVGGTLSPGFALLLAEDIHHDRQDIRSTDEILFIEQFDLIADFLDQSFSNDRGLLIGEFDLIADFLDQDALDIRFDRQDPEPSSPNQIWLIEEFDLIADFLDESILIYQPSPTFQSPQAWELGGIVETCQTTPKISPNSRRFSSISREKKSHKIRSEKIAPLTVRVAFDRLERMNNLVGELSIERNSLALQNEQLIDTLRRIRLNCENFQTINDRLQQFGDKHSFPHRQPLFDSPNLDLTQQFDPLELDHYSEIYTITQATVEQLAQIEEQIEDITLFSTRSAHQIDRQRQLISSLRDDIMWSRMLPLGEILNRFPRTIHDLSVKYDKPCDLKIIGAGVLVDRVAIEKLLDPLVHLLRNAFDHGIDLLEARQAAGKPDRGVISITAYHQGDRTVIEVCDDGGGIDFDMVKAKAISLKILAVDTTASKEQILDTIFNPGFSTTEQVTELSGRGMGLDIVKAAIQSIKGTISIDSQLGKGTIFTLRIPLTLTIAQLTICQAGNAIYAFPSDSIQRIVIPTASQLQQQGNFRFFHWQTRLIPVYNLTEILTYSIPVIERTIPYTLDSGVKNPSDWLAPLIIIDTGEQIVALEIDRTIGEQELTIKPFGKAITPPSYSYGCTILSDGSILPVLDPQTLIRVTIDRPDSPLIKSIPAPPPIESALILIVDDSMTTRQSLRLTLEKYGYRTLSAKDGQEALQILRQKVGEIKLVICDVEMPNMNGFEFLNIRRQDRTITHIPVVMLTSRSNKKHREFAGHLGAIDYFIKPYVETDFIKSIEKLF